MSDHESWSGAPSILQSVSLSNYACDLQREVHQAREEIKVLGERHQTNMRELEEELEHHKLAHGEARQRAIQLEEQIAELGQASSTHESPSPVRSPVRAVLPVGSSNSDGSDTSFSSVADLRRQLRHLEGEKTELAEALNGQLVEAQLQIHQLHARCHEQEEKLRNQRNGREIMCTNLDTVARCVDSSRSAIDSALGRVSELSTDGVQWADGVHKHLLSSRKALLQQDARLQQMRRQIDETSGSSTEGSPSGAQSSVGSRRGVTRRSRSRESEGKAQRLSGLFWDEERSDSWDLEGTMKGKHATGVHARSIVVSPAQQPAPEPKHQHQEPEEQCSCVIS